MNNLYAEVAAAIESDMEIERIMDNVHKDAQRIKTLGKQKQRKPSSKDAWHCDPSEGQRFADDAQGWIIGATIVAVIAAIAVFAHSLDYWGL